MALFESLTARGMKQPLAQLISEVSPSAIPVPIADGGTGQTTAAAAFDALAPTTTRGDLITRDASTNVRLAKGATGTVLTAGATDVSWVAPGTSINVQAFSAAGAATWTKPPSGTMALIMVWGAGGSGGRAGSGDFGGGGGGGAYNEITIPLSKLGATEPVTVGTGGAARTVDDTDGEAGGNTTFGVYLTGYGGGGGEGATALDGAGGGGGGQGSAGTVGSGDGATGGAGGSSIYGTTAAAEFTALGGQWTSGGVGGASPNGGRNSTLGGGGGGSGVTGGANGGGSMRGGGGGGGALTAGTTVGGSSTSGGNGGAGASGANNATAGSQPGGGGGGSTTGNSGAGGNGYCVVVVF